MPNLTPEALLLGMVSYIVFLFSTTCHEAAHALAAKLGGDLTAYHGGQVSLNPWPHIRREPFGMALVPLVSLLLRGSLMGWASAPFDPDWQARYPRRAAWMALAGPAANFTLMIFAAIGIRVGVALGHFESPESANLTRIAVIAGSGEVSFLTTLLSVMFVMNLLLGTFNLLPVPPLDGSSAIMLGMSHETALRYQSFLREPGFALMGIIAAWYGYGYVFDRLFTVALNLLYPGAHYG